MISKSNVKCTDSNVKFADSEVRMASRFASSTQQEIEKLLEDKDSENTKRSTKVAKELFYEYLKDKNIQEPHDKKESAQVLKSFYVEARKKDGSFYSMTVIAAIMRLSLFSSKQCIIKQLLDSAFVISGMIRVEVSVISRSRRLRLITLTSTLIILDITKTSSNN